MSEPTDPSYVTQHAWVRTLARPDLIDEIADQFERPSEPVGTPQPAETRKAGWPQRSRGWRSINRLHSSSPAAVR